MIGTIIRKEVVETLLGPKFIITFLISFILIITSVYSGYNLYESDRRWYVTAESSNVDRMQNLGSYGKLKDDGTKALREPERMSIFVKGVDSTVGRSAVVSDDPSIVLRDSRNGLNPIFAVFGELDLAFIVKIETKSINSFFSSPL